MATSYDAIIIGAGHNGLVTACYLAKAGWKVLVLERRHLVGGACVSEEIFPGFKVSTAAYVNSLFRKQIVRDLKLASYGFVVLERSPSSFSPFPDGRSHLLGPDAELTHREIAKFSTRDAAAYPEYEKMLERVAAVVEPTLDRIPPMSCVPDWGICGKDSSSGAPCRAWARGWAKRWRSLPVRRGRSSIAGSSPIN